MLPCFRDARAGERQSRLVVEDDTVDRCRDDPGRDVTVVVDATVRGLTEVSSGDRTPVESIPAGAIRIDTARRAAARPWSWLGASASPGRRVVGGSPVRASTRQILDWIG